MKERKGQPVHVRPSLIARKRIDYAKQFGLSESGFVTLILEHDMTKSVLEQLKRAHTETLKRLIEDPVP